MTAHSPLSRRVVEIIAPLEEELADLHRQLAAFRSKIESVTLADREIAAACRALADAVDQLEQAKFSGAAELPARRKLERTAEALRRVMVRHGRAGGAT